MEQRQKKQSQRVRVQRARSRRQKKQNKAGMIGISCVVCLLLVAMSTQIVRLYQENQEYKVQEKELRSQLENEQERKEDIVNYEAFVTTKDYIEQVAKTKLGLVYPNEIIFKEKSRE